MLKHLSISPFLLPVLQCFYCSPPPSCYRLLTGNCQLQNNAPIVSIARPLIFPQTIQLPNLQSYIVFPFPRHASRPLGVLQFCIVGGQLPSTSSDVKSHLGEHFARDGNYPNALPVLPGLEFSSTFCIPTILPYHWGHPYSSAESACSPTLPVPNAQE